jgi:hypothetical protein
LGGGIWTDSSIQNEEIEVVEAFVVNGYGVMVALGKTMTMVLFVTLNSSLGAVPTKNAEKPYLVRFKTVVCLNSMTSHKHLRVS